MLRICKPLTRVFTAMITWLILSASHALAQVNINPADIKKINIMDSGGGLIGFRQTIFEIVPVNKVWKSYQTKQLYNGPGYLHRRDSAKYIALNSNQRKFVKNVGDATILKLLESIKTITPAFDPAAIRPDMAVVIHKIDSSYLSKSYPRLTIRQKQEFINFLNDKKVIDDALISIQNDSWTDDGPYCGINIIKTNNDTIKIETYRQTDLMLPWDINGVKSYDNTIGKFVIACIGNYPYSVSQRLSGADLYHKISEYIQRSYTNDMFERERWDEAAPLNVEVLKRNFTIMQVDGSNENSSFTFLCKNLPVSVVINGILDIKDGKKIMQLVKFAADTLSMFIKTDNFLVKKCRDSAGCTIRFANTLGASNRNYNVAKAHDKAGYLRRYNETEILPFAVDVKGTSCASDWLYLPDGKLLLMHYCDDGIFGIPAGSLKSSGNTLRKSAFIFFSSDGKYLGANP